MLAKLVYAKYHCPLSYQLLLLFTSEWASLFSQCFTFQPFFVLLCSIFYFFRSDHWEEHLYLTLGRGINTQVRKHFLGVWCGTEPFISVINLLGSNRWHLSPFHLELLDLYLFLSLFWNILICCPFFHPLPFCSGYYSSTAPERCRSTSPGGKTSAVVYLPVGKFPCDKDI